MYIQHFMKMFFGLIVMAIIGLGFLALVNHYNNREPLAGITPTLTKGGTSTASASKTPVLSKKL